MIFVRRIMHGMVARVSHVHLTALGEAILQEVHPPFTIVYANLGTKGQQLGTGDIFCMELHVICVIRTTHGMVAHVSRVQVIVLLRLDRRQGMLDRVHVTLGTQGHHVRTVRLITYGVRMCMDGMDSLMDSDILDRVSRVEIVVLLRLVLHQERHAVVTVRPDTEIKYVTARAGTQGHHVISVQLIMYGMVAHVSRVQLIVLLRVDRRQGMLDHVHV